VKTENQTSCRDLQRLEERFADLCWYGWGAGVMWVRMSVDPPPSSSPGNTTTLSCF